MATRKHEYVALFGALASTLYAQPQPQPPPEIRLTGRPYFGTPALHVETNLVEVAVVVRDRDGRPIPGLKRESFAVTDEGRKRDLSYFAVEAQAPAKAVQKPRFIALFFDDFGTKTSDLVPAQVAGGRFIQDDLDANDKVAIFSSSGAFVDYTNDKAKLIAAIGKLRAHPPFSESDDTCARLDPFEAYEIAVLHDPVAMETAKASAGCTEAKGSQRATLETMIQTLAEVYWGRVRVASQTTLAGIEKAIRSLQNAPGQRVAILVSSGFTTGTLESEQDRLIDLALHAGVVMNAVNATRLDAATPGTAAKNPTRQSSVGYFVYQAVAPKDRSFARGQSLSDFAQATGGLYIHNDNALVNGLRGSPRFRM